MQKTQTILVVDDEALNISILAEELSKHYEIRVAKSGQHAIDFLQTSHVDLILLDIMMPEMDGYEVFQRLRDNERTRHIPVIFITASNEDADEEKGLEMGAVDYIAKPGTKEQAQAAAVTAAQGTGWDALLTPTAVQ